MEGKKLIYLEDAVEALHKHFADGFEEDRFWNSTHVLTALKDTPAAKPERQTGHWYYDENGMDWNLGAWKCSECRGRNDNIPSYIQMQGKACRVGNPLMWQGSRFCPNCGAAMMEEP